MQQLKKMELSPSTAIIIAGIIIAGAIVFTNGRQAAANPGSPSAGTAPTNIAVRPPSANDHIIGSPNAPIVLIEYSDFQCPYCSMVYPTLKKIVDESNGQIAWVYRQFPLTSIHPQANPSANASECIAEQLGSAGFWKYAEAVLANQANLSPAYSAQIAQQLGADPAKYAQCVSSSKYQKVIDTDSAEAQSMGGNGTPYTIVLNTKTGKAAPVSGALPYAQVMSVIKSVQ